MKMCAMCYDDEKETSNIIETVQHHEMLLSLCDNIQNNTSRMAWVGFICVGFMEVVHCAGERRRARNGISGMGRSDFSVGRCIDTDYLRGIL